MIMIMMVITMMMSEYVSNINEAIWLLIKSHKYLSSFGVFLPYFKEHFNAGSGEISTVNSIQMGVTFASGNYEADEWDQLLMS